MLKDGMNLSLAGRAEQFQTTLNACEFTDTSGVRLAPEGGVLRAVQILRAARDRGNSVYFRNNY